MKCTKQEQEIKDCLIRLLQDYNGSWNDLKKEKRFKELMKYNKLKGGIMKKQKKQFILWDNNIKSIKEAITKKNKLESQGYTLKQNTITNGNMLIYVKKEER